MNDQKNSQIQVKETRTIRSRFDEMFHVTDRGSSIGQEVKAGISVFLISVCALFMNIQIIAEAYSANITYCGIYLGATIVAFIGTLLLGVLCNLPLVQTASLSMSMVMISMLGANSNFSYANMLALTFVSALVYVMAMAIPGMRRFVVNLIPKSVRNALPAAMGLYITYVALNNIGIIENLRLASLSTEALGGASIAKYMRMCVFAGIIGFSLVLYFKKRSSQSPALSGFLIGTLVFYLIASIAGGIIFSYVFTQNRIWIGVNPDPLGEMYTIALGFKELSIGSIFREGFDFSSYTQSGGNVIALFAQSILMFLFMGMYESEAAVQGADLNGAIFKEGDYEAQVGKLLFVNALTNVIAPIFGAAPMSIGKQSSVATTDGGKTGLSSIVCSIGYFIAMFTWIPFVIFASYTKSVPEYGHAGFVFPNVIYAVFQIADGVMLVMGLMMLKAFTKLKNAAFQEVISFATTVVITVFTSNIAYGVAAASIIYLFLSLASFQKAEIKEVKAAQYVMALFAIILLTLSMTATIADGNTTDNASTNIETNSSLNENDFTFDANTGMYSFIGSDEASYYTVWIYSLDSEGNESESYKLASSRLSGSGEISGNLDLSGLSYGYYHVKLISFYEGGTNPTPISLTISISGKLSTPEFMYSQDGEEVIITLSSDMVAIYKDSEMFTDIDVNIYNESGEIYATDTITEDDLVETLMGPMTSYSCEKTITLDAGAYEISLTAKGDGDIVEVSEESEKLSLVIENNMTSEAMTSGYV